MSELDGCNFVSAWPELVDFRFCEACIYLRGTSLWQEQHALISVNIFEPSLESEQKELGFVELCAVERDEPIKMSRILLVIFFFTVSIQ